MEFVCNDLPRLAFGFMNPNHAAVEYDGCGQLLAVKDADGNAVERYAYDKAGNMTKKTVLVQGAGCLVPGAEERKYKTTTFTFDDANQLVSSTTDGITTRYEYDAAGRIIKEGDKTYTYGYLDKVLSVTEGNRIFNYTYHPDGQLASANYGDSSESFAWDGLALVQRGDEQFVNEPHIGGGNPVASSKGTSFFNDMLGTTVGAKKGSKYSAAALSAFGEDLNHHSSTSTSNFNSFFTGKPAVAGLGHAFLMRNYRAGLAKWQTADPLGYPDGWNQLAYCNNGVTSALDLWGGEEIELIITTEWFYQKDADNSLLGYTMVSAFKYMKDQWKFGKGVMGVLKIKTVEDLVGKASDKTLSKEVKAELQKILGSDNWLDKLLLADANSCYSHVEPTEKEILQAFKEATGKDSYDDCDDPILASVKIDYDDSNPGLWIVDGAEQVWKVNVRYE